MTAERIEPDPCFCDCHGMDPCREVEDCPQCMLGKFEFPDPNPLDPTNKFFRLCPKGHVAYSVDFPECPSCKVERERALSRGVPTE